MTEALPGLFSKRQYYFTTLCVIVLTLLIHLPNRNRYRLLFYWWACYKEWLEKL